MCNNLGKDIFITDELKENLDNSSGYDIVYMGDYKLRGKKDKEKVYGIAI